MRPIDRGAIPTDAAGNPKIYAKYQDARGDLYDRLGRYCSFCERPILSGMAVEHVHHKKGYPHLEREWSNFLLACNNCNSSKGIKKVPRSRLFFPDQDNTFRALTYSVGGVVTSNSVPTPAMKGKATRLIRLVGLDMIPTPDPQVKDMRWNDRREAWDKATRYLGQYAAGFVSVSTIADLCRAEGHWSIWMNVFELHADIRRTLISMMRGMPAGCFNAQTVPQLRPGGQIVTVRPTTSSNRHRISRPWGQPIPSWRPHHVSVSPPRLLVGRGRSVSPVRFDAGRLLPHPPSLGPFLPPMALPPRSKHAGR